IRFCAVATWANKKVPDKMPELFIEALAKLQTNLKQTIILTMIGGGDKVDELTKLCIQKGLESEFLGYQTKTEIAQQLQLSDFFVHASTIETFGVVTAEALMCGTPVICSNVGALPELIDESNGILCENSVDSWIVGLRKAISTSFNNKEISGKIKQKYSLLEIGKQFSSVYSEI
ncbi:MAG TPA: glycosyltransferase, partial [Paludibacter sp.]